MERILNTCFLFFHFGLGCGTDLDNRDAADELRQALLELFSIVIAGCTLDLRPNLIDATFDRLCITGTVNNRAVVLVDNHFLSSTELLKRCVLELEA